MAQSYRRRRPTILGWRPHPRYHRAHGHPVPLGRRTRRPSRASRAHRCRARRGSRASSTTSSTSTRSWPSCRPTTSPRRRRRSSSRTSFERTSSRPSLPVEAVLANAPARDGDFIVVPADPRRTVTDPTRLLAHEMAALLRAGDVSSHELTEAHLAAAERDNHGLNAWLTIDRERALAEADAADARLAAAADRPGPRARHAATAAGHPGRAQGPRVRGGRPVHRGLADPRGLPRAIRRAHHRAAARGRRGHPGQDQHGRVRDGLVDRAFGLRPDRQPVGARPRARAAAAAARRPPSPRTTRRSRSAPTPAARSASRRRCAGSSA